MWTRPASRDHRIICQERQHGSSHKGTNTVDYPYGISSNDDPVIKRMATFEKFCRAQVPRYLTDARDDISNSCLGAEASWSPPVCVQVSNRILHVGTRQQEYLED